MNPSGRLLFTWPRRLEDTPSFLNWPTNDNDEIFYDEGLSVGYRYYDQPDAPKPLFPFGHGLSYTTFEVRDLKFEGSTTLNAESSLNVTCKVTNTGPRDGKIVVQFYIRRVDSSSFKEANIEKELKGFTKTFVESGKICSDGGYRSISTRLATGIRGLRRGRRRKESMRFLRGFRLRILLDG
jgi:beta-glucosidase